LEEVEIRGAYGNNQYNKTKSRQPNLLVVVVYRGFSPTTTKEKPYRTQP
jgi:hypothetical protein